MQAQVAIGAGHNKGMTLERRINLMLENGFNVFVLRWRKIFRFSTSSFGYEVLSFMQKTSRGNLETSYVPIVERGELVWVPDEMGVPVGYCADTPYNRKLIATAFYVAQYSISGLITPTGTVHRDVINAEMQKYAESLGIKAPVKMKLVGVYGNALPMGSDLSKINDKKEPESPIDVAKSVFKTEEKMKAAIPEPPSEEDRVKLTQEECLQQGELSALTRFQPLVDKLQKEKKKYWKGSQYYKDIIEPEIKKETARLLLENGHALETNPPNDGDQGQDAPPAKEEATVAA